MSGDRSTLLLRLVGPMQSWGFRSRFDNRDTALEPTRSGVIGLLCAALGWERDHDLAPFQNLNMGVRIDAPGRVMVDYQTAQEVIRAGGGAGATVQSWRYYLSDARFLVGLESDDLGWLRELDVALRNPVFPLFLGRKSYVPSLPIALPRTGVLQDENLEDALKAQTWWYCREREKRDLEARSSPGLRLRIETDNAEDGAASSDYPLDFARRRFRARMVIEGKPVIPQQMKKDELCISRN